MSAVTLIWQDKREVRVTLNAKSSMSSSSLLGFGNFSNHSGCNTTWQVAHANDPSQVASMLTPFLVATSITD